MTSVPEFSFSHMGIFVTDPARMEDFTHASSVLRSPTGANAWGPFRLVFLSDEKSTIR